MATVDLPPEIRVEVVVPLHSRGGRMVDEKREIVILPLGPDLRVAEEGSLIRMPLVVSGIHEGGPFEALREIAIPAEAAYAETVTYTVAPVLVGPTEVERTTVVRDKDGAIKNIRRARFPVGEAS